VLDLEPETEQVFLDVLVSGDGAGVRTLMAELHPADAADLLERLGPDERAHVVEILRDDFDPEILSELDETVRDHVVECLGVENVAAVIAGMESDDALEVIEELDEDEQQQVLDAIPPGDRTLIKEGLTYPEDSAGRLMQREVVTVPEFWTVGETIDFLRQSADSGDDELPARFYDVFIVDPAHRPVGSLTLSRLLRTRRPVAVADIMDTEMKLLPVATDQEEVAYVFRQRDLVSAPVVDDGGRLVGAITIDDVVDVIDEEHEEDIMRLGGVKEDDLYEATMDTTRSRFGWLLINLGTAILASIVIGLFDATIEQMVALAVLMPIVASMGGNAGTQTLTVAVRALAMKELTAANAGRVIGKELLVGALNGVLFAALIGAVAWIWFGSGTLGVVIGLAMIVNMLVAGLAGTTIPLMLYRIGVDPAVASSVFLTTVTDVVGFFVFLGLAALILL
jgi:magnesium transporter|tara:strand:+ start:1094 stop:2449 length:1356 start_codon:yes stop_codon:yes gene_type:complete